MDTSHVPVSDAQSADDDRRLARPVARFRDAIQAVDGPGGTGAVREAAVELVRLARQRSTTTHRRPSDHEGLNVVASLRLAAQVLQRRRGALEPQNREALVGILGRGIRRMHELGRVNTGAPTFDAASLLSAARARPDVTLVGVDDLSPGTVASGDLREVRDVVRALRRAIGNPKVVRVVPRPEAVGLCVGDRHDAPQPARWTVELPPAYSQDMTVTVEMWPAADEAASQPDVRATVWLPAAVVRSDRD